MPEFTKITGCRNVRRVKHDVLPKLSESVNSLELENSSDEEKSLVLMK